MKIHDLGLPRAARPCDLSEVRRPREIKKYDAGRRHRRHRVQKQVRNVSSDVPATFCGDWRHLNVISRKSSKSSIFSKNTPFGKLNSVTALTCCYTADCAGTGRARPPAPTRRAGNLATTPLRGRNYRLCCGYRAHGRRYASVTPC